jgi:hypothetical protein
MPKSADNFRTIDFGLARAELECVEHPILIERGFLDTQNIVPELMQQNKYLVLGYKGSGKSALAEKLRLESGFRTHTITTIKYLSDFPYTSFAKIMTGKEDPEVRFPTTWSWLLLILLLDSFSKDQASPTLYDSQFVKAVSSLTELGLLPPDNLNTVVARSSKSSFKVEIPKFLEKTFEDTRVPTEMDMQFRQMVEHLKQLAFQYKSPNRHILLVDGLDDILLGREIQYLSLAALVYETDRLNLTFIQNDVPAKIILLCRTDLFERLPGPNKNKIRQDSAHEIVWYHDPRNPRDSLLVQLVNLRASIHFHRNVDIFPMFFPDNINGHEPISHLLERTRHTPRDFIQLMNNLQLFYRGQTFNNSEILSGIRQYSLRYFLPEIRDELAGYIPSEHFDALIRVVKSLRQRDFSYDQILRRSQSTGLIEKVQLDNLLHALYECSAIGNRWRSPISRDFRFEYKYRNPSSALNTEEDITLHPGLWKALNLE